MRVRRAALIASLGLASAGLAAVPANAACAMAPPRISLTNFEFPQGPRQFYLGVEGAPTTVTVQISGGCGGATMSVDFATSPGTASPGSDYTHVSSPPRISATPPDDGSESVLKPVSILPGGAGEAIVESLQFTLSNPQATAGAGTPTLINGSAPILVVDTDGASRVGFEGVAYSLSETFSTARIPVFRAGPATTPSTVTYTIAPDPAAPATPGEDYTATSPGTLQFGPNERVKTIDLAVINDKLGEGPENVNLTLSSPSMGTSIENGQTTFTIEDNEESAPPSSRLHHPRHKWRYKKSDYRIREVHIFAHDNPGGAGVVGAQLALRRNLKSGDCVWLTKSGWEKKECSNRQWLDGEYDSAGELWRIRLKQLKSSVRSSIKDYTAYSRAIDGAENVEKEFNEKRNANTFEVKPKKKMRR